MDTAIDEQHGDNAEDGQRTGPGIMQEGGRNEPDRPAEVQQDKKQQGIQEEDQPAVAEFIGTGGKAHREPSFEPEIDEDAAE